jgi:signal transduction histidine kinase
MKRTGISVSILLGVFLTGGFYYFLIMQNLTKTSFRIYQHLMISFEPHQRVLLNARWPAQRIEYLMGPYPSQEQKKYQDIVDLQMLQLSFGTSYDYFLIRSKGGKTKVEIRNGGLSTSKSRVSIQDEIDLLNETSGFFIRPCRLEEKEYVCLIDIPPARDFVSSTEQNYSLIAIPFAELMLAARQALETNSWFYPRLNATFKLRGKTHWLTPPPSMMTVFRVSKQVDKGFEVEVGHDLKNSFFHFSIFLFSIVLIASIFIWAILKYVNAITKLKMAQLENNEKTKYFKKLNSLIHGVIHDIKSPMTAIQSLVHQEMNHDRRLIMGHVVKRMKMIISDLETKNEENQLTQQSFLPVHHLVSLFVQEKTKEYNHAITIRYENNHDPCWIMGLYSQFMRMMSNLVNNSFEASSRGDLVEIILKVKEKSVCSIEVKDWGVGIKEEYLSSVFLKGFSSKKNGSGVGLYQCKKIVETMNGNIQIKSKPGMGTSIFITLPAVDPPDWGTSIIRLTDASDLVVVDDDPFYEGYWKDLLKHLQIKVSYFNHPCLVPYQLLKSYNTVCIMDNNFNLNQGLGLEFLKQNGIFKAYLITNDWSSPLVQSDVSALKLKLIGKDFLPLVEVTS